MDKDIKILGLVFGCLIVLFFISGNITGQITWPWTKRIVDTQQTSFRYVKPVEDTQPQQVETTQFKTDTSISKCSNILTKDQCNTLCGSYYADVVYDVPVIAGPTTKCIDSDGGFNVFVAGTCKDSNGDHSDECTSNSYLREYYCKDNKCVSYGWSCPGASKDWGGMGSCWPYPREGVGMCYGPKEPSEADEPIPKGPPVKSASEF